MKFIQRKVFFQVKKHLSKPEISLILGPRQAGKTTIMLKLTEELQGSSKPSIYFNLDIIEDKQYFQTQHTLTDRIKSLIGNRRGVIFIDEVHRLENAGLFLKGLYDMQTSHKFIVSGSGSLELKANLIEPMTGRKRIFYCLPLSFSEFVAYKLKVPFGQVPERLKTNPSECQRLMGEYLTYGGYPRAVLVDRHQEKIEILSEIYKSYLEKDIQLLLKVEKREVFEALVKILAGQTGNLVNRAKVASTLTVSEKTIKKYLYLLEKTFVISLVKPFFRSAQKEVRKSPKVYFLDLGLLHYARGMFPTPSREIKGDVFENACFLRLKELAPLKPALFWRTLSGAEVDFVIFSSKSGKPIPIEIKCSPGKTEKLGKSFISFLKKYQPKRAYVYTKNTKASFDRLGVRVTYLPFWALPRI